MKLAGPCQLTLILALGCLAAGTARAQTSQPFEFTRMVAHWANYDRDDYLSFIEDARPEVVQLGFYGGHFWSLSHTAAFKGYPAHFPVRGLSECGNWFTNRNKNVKALDAKVIGHFNVEFLVGDPQGDDGPTGFFKFYRELWDEKELGPRPVANPIDLLEKDIHGRPISQEGYGIGGMKEYWGCLRNPHWQAVLKAWVNRGIERGVDGYIANYFYRHDCHCEHCQKAFRSYLKERFSPAELKQRFRIEDLQSHRFREIVAWHPPDESTPLRREMLRFSQVSNKQAFDEVFHRYGRSLKPDLITAQWNHLGAFNQIRGDERCMLPSELWGKDESYLWYSTGGSANATDLAEGDLGEGTLHARYIRGAFNDKPFTLGKYENTRIRVAISELAAKGGAPMGFYTRFTDPMAREVIVRYYQFLKQYDQVYRGNTAHAEAALLFPRTAVHRGEVEAVSKFRELGHQMLNQHILFDILPDDIATPRELSAYDHVARVADERQELRNADSLSRFEAPATVRVSASRPAGAQGAHELDLHFVNYHRDEPPKDKRGRPSPGGGVKDEKPIAAPSIRCDVRIPSALRSQDISRIDFISPEQSQAVSVKLEVGDGRVKFTTPSFLVYGVARIHFR